MMIELRPLMHDRSSLPLANWASEDGWDAEVRDRADQIDGDDSQCPAAARTK